MEQHERIPDFQNDAFAANALPTFVNYVEGIYVGYKYYETAAVEGAIDYDDVVQYPFGYGLSYTTFDQRMGDISYNKKTGTVKFNVTVTNTGTTAGKDVVETMIIRHIPMGASKRRLRISSHSRRPGC